MKNDWTGLIEMLVVATIVAVISWNWSATVAERNVLRKENTKLIEACKASIAITNAYEKGK